MLFIVSFLSESAGNVLLDTTDEVSLAVWENVCVFTAEKANIPVKISTGIVFI